MNTNPVDVISSCDCSFSTGYLLNGRHESVRSIFGSHSVRTGMLMKLHLLIKELSNIVSCAAQRTAEYVKLDCLSRKVDFSFQVLKGGIIWSKDESLGCCELNDRKNALHSFSAQQFTTRQYKSKTW